MGLWDKIKKRVGYKEKKRAAYIAVGKATAKHLASEAEEYLFGPEEEVEQVDPEEQARLEAKAAKQREKEEKRRRKEEARKAKQRASDIERELAELKKRAGKD